MNHKQLLILAKEIEIKNSYLGNASLFNSSTGPVIIYTEDGGSINSSNVSGLIINYDLNNSGGFSFDNTTANGAAIARKLSGPNIEILIHYNKSKLKAEKLKK